MKTKINSFLLTILLVIISTVVSFAVPNIKVHYYPSGSTTITSNTINGSDVFNKRAFNFSPTNKDFEGGQREYFDVYFSTPTGDKVSESTNCVTIVGQDFMQTNDAFKIARIDLENPAGFYSYYSVVTGKYGGSNTNVNQNNAIDGNLNTYTNFGNTLTSKWISLTVCEPKPIIKDPPGQYVDVCCPPINPEVAAKQFKYVGSGDITMPYTIKFQPTPQFQTTMQNYLNFVNSWNDPTINKVSIIWSLHDCGSDSNPKNCLWNANPSLSSVPIDSSGTWWEVPALTTTPNYKTWGTQAFFGKLTDDSATTFDDRFPMIVGNKYRVGAWTHFPPNTEKGTPEKWIKDCVVPDFFVQLKVGAQFKTTSPSLELSDARGKIIDRIPIREIKK